MATYTGLKAILTEFKNRMIKTKVDSATSADSATDSDKVDGYHVGTSYPALVPVTACSLGSSSGYIKLGNGLIVQWGRISSESDGSYSVSFPLSYTTIPAVTTDFTTYKTPGDDGYHLKSVSKTGFVSCYGPPFAWIAIGS